MRARQPYIQRSVHRAIVWVVLGGWREKEIWRWKNSWTLSVIYIYKQTHVYLFSLCSLCQVMVRCTYGISPRDSASIASLTRGASWGEKCVCRRPASMWHVEPSLAWWMSTMRAVSGSLVPLRWGQSWTSPLPSVTSSLTPPGVCVCVCLRAWCECVCAYACTC